MTVTDPLHCLRVAGWSVAIHNDYRQDGQLRTFYLRLAKDQSK